MKERILLMGPPGSGKTTQLYKTIKFLEDRNIPVYAIDLEDKLEAMLDGLNDRPKNLKLFTAFTWEELKTDDKSVQNQIEALAKPGHWIMIDRVDLSWPLVQRWFTQQKYQEDLAERMMKKSLEMKKSSMFLPRFDQGSWQVINEQYESFIMTMLYKLRCNVMMTTGIRGVDENSPQDIYGNLGLMPRGQKEIGHQPHSVFLLLQRRINKETSWMITTAKDLPNRTVFEGEELFDFSVQYIESYYKP